MLKPREGLEKFVQELKSKVQQPLLKRNLIKNLYNINIWLKLKTQ